MRKGRRINKPNKPSRSKNNLNKNRDKNPILKDKHKKGDTNGIFSKIFGDLKPKKSKSLEGVEKEVVDEIKADQYGRIPLVFEEDTDERDKSPVGSIFKTRKKESNGFTSDKQRELARESRRKRFQIIRQENDGYRPLHELNIWNKLRTAKRYRDEKSGKIAEREAAKRRKVEEQKIKIESKIKRELTEITDRIIDGEMEEATVEITVDPEHMDCLEKVLMGDYFAMFDVEQRKPNKNLKIYNIFPPISLRFKRNLKRSQI